MSIEAARDFRFKIYLDPALQSEMHAAIKAGRAYPEAVRLGREAGFEFTADEAAELMTEVGEGELSDLEIEAVSAGKGGTGGKGGSGQSGRSNGRASMGVRG